MGKVGKQMFCDFTISYIDASAVSKKTKIYKFKVVRILYYEY
jgi:hypothetical protein